jgi:transcriptional regulator with XRE-family HTH domain
VTPLTMTAASLKKWRERVSLTQAGLATELGLTQQMLSHYEGGVHAIPPRTVKQLIDLADRLGIDPPRYHPNRVKV